MKNKNLRQKNYVDYNENSMLFIYRGISLQYLGLKDRPYYVEFLWEDCDTIFYRLRIEKGENAINTLDLYSEEYQKKLKKRIKETRYVIHDHNGIRVIDKLPSDIRIRSLGANTIEDLQNHINWKSRAEDLFYEKEGFVFEDPMKIEWNLVDNENYIAEQVVDPDIEEANQIEKSKLRMVRIPSGISQSYIFYGFKYEGGTLDDCIAAGRFVCFELSDWHNIHYVDSMKGIHCDKYFIEVDKKIKSSYPNKQVEPISFTYDNVYYIIKDRGRERYIRFGMDDQIYPIKHEEKINKIAKKKDSLFHQALIETIKNHCLKEYNYKIG